MTTVRISHALADAYMSRAVHEFIRGAGRYSLSAEQVTDLHDDAAHQIAEVWPEGYMPIGEYNAYRGILRQTTVVAA